MRIHSQSSTKFTFNEKKDLLIESDRHHHDAIEVACPHCGASAGQPCKDLQRRSVHMARQDASL